MANSTPHFLLSPALALVLFPVGPGTAQGPGSSVSSKSTDAIAIAADSPNDSRSPLADPGNADAQPRLPNAREASLSGVLQTRRQIEADLLPRQQALSSAGALGREAEMQALSNQLSELNRNFSELAAGVDPVSIELDQTPQELNLTSEVRDLLGPLVNELKRATSRPREIDRLRIEIAELYERLKQVRKATSRLKKIETTFGLDYADQAEITTSMREIMERGVDFRWRDSRWADALLSVSAEFREAGASSLDYYVRVDLDGSCALDLQAQSRQLARFCVDVRNENGWVIPFTQLTVHVAKDVSPKITGVADHPDLSAPTTAVTSGAADILPTTE